MYLNQFLTSSVKRFTKVRQFSTNQTLRDYDVCIIGCGPAGFAAAMRAYDYGKKCCVIEKNRVGGAGVHNGALSSKTMWELSLDYRKALSRTEQKGAFKFKEIELEYGDLSQSITEAQQEKENQMKQQLHKLGIPFYSGSARFINPHQVEVKGKDTQTIAADNFVIATGSVPRKHNLIEADGEHILTSDHILELKDFPKSMVIIGGGVIGCEYATIFSNFNKTKVNLLDKAERILPFEDEDIASFCSKLMEAKGVTIHGGSQLQSIKVADGRVHYTIKCSSPNHEDHFETHVVDKALLAIGRVPNLDSLDLEKAGVKVTKGYIDNVDSQTTAPHIYAVGDATVDIALVNIGEIEGRHAIDRIFGDSTKPISYNNISSIMFLDPEVAAVGMNELTARKNKIDYKVARYSYQMVSRAIAQRATSGLVKLLVSNDEQMRILGIRALGQDSGSLIEVVSLMIRKQLSVRDLYDLLVAYPSVAEGLQECVRLFQGEKGSSVYKPTVFPKQIHVAEYKFEK